MAKRVSQGHGKNGEWTIGYDRADSAERRPGLWTPKKEEQVRGQFGGQVKGNQRSEQRRQKGRGENETERREDRNKLSTWFMDKFMVYGLISRRVGRKAAYRVETGQGKR